MNVISGVENLQQALKSSLVTLGNFDGVHLGHRHLIGELVRYQRNQEPIVVITFDPHPIRVLYPEREFVKISDEADLEEMLIQLGVDFLVRQPFTKEFSKIAPVDFMENYIRIPFSPSRIVVGYDFAFGHERSGGFAQLQSYFSNYGTQCESVTPFKVSGEVVSSRGIRDLVKLGNMAKARLWLDRFFSLNGIVVAGAGRGKGLGFATLNVKPTVELLPMSGVYACYAWIHGTRYQSVSNIGISPTFTPDGPVRLECHVLGVDLNGYGEKVKIEFVERIRDEIKFTSVDQLKNQITKDVITTKAILDRQR